MLEPLPAFNSSLFFRNSTVIVGLSGGPDSVYLLHHLVKYQESLQLTIIAAHLDHEWQETSKIASNLCKKLCDDLRVELFIQKRSEMKFQPLWNGSQEQVGRLLRRHLFESLAQKYNAQAIALAHHQDDQHETFFIRLIRGASLQGLACMKEQDGLYIRPLLGCKKKDILAYLDAHAIPYYLDPTNTSPIYLRNKIRHQVMPALQAVDTRWDEKVSSAINHIQDVDTFLDHHVHDQLAKLSTTDGIDRLQFLQLYPVIQQRMLMMLMIKQKCLLNPSQALFKEIMRFLEKSGSGKHTLHPLWIIRKNKNSFNLVKNDKSL